MAQQLVSLPTGRQLASLLAVVPGLLRETFLKGHGLPDASPPFHWLLCRLPDHDMLA
jgi:hypothetical protein